MSIKFIKDYPIQITLATLLITFVFIATTSYNIATIHANDVSRISTLERSCNITAKGVRQNSADIDKQDLQTVEIKGQLKYMTGVLEEIRAGMKR